MAQSWARRRHRCTRRWSPVRASPYGAAKASVEAWCSAFAASYGLDTVSLRFSNVYGPMSFHKGSVVAAFMRRIVNGAPLVVYGDGSQTRDYIYADDLCEGILAAMKAGRSGVFQLGSGTGTTISRLIEEIGKVVGPGFRPEIRHEPFRAGEIRHNWTDVGKGARRARLGAVHLLARRARTHLGMVSRTHVRSLAGAMIATSRRDRTGR